MEIGARVRDKDVPELVGTVIGEWSSAGYWEARCDTTFKNVGGQVIDGWVDLERNLVKIDGVA